MSLFVDTSVWYAAADSGDTSSARAKELLTTGESLITSDHILVEAWLLLRHRLGRFAAEKFWSGLRSGVATIETVRTGDLEIAWAISEVYPDHDFSIVDRTSFAVMQRLGVHRALSFDSDFSIYRFGPGRKRAFTVLS